MFRPRYAYKSSITKRYRGTARGCPVFNNIADINSDMVEQHDQCLECLAKIKNRNDLYKTLASNKKPNNNVIKSLQRLSSSASNNRLKTCLQFLIIKVNETKITPTETTNISNNNNTNLKQRHQQANQKHDTRHTKDLNVYSPQSIQQTKIPDNLKQNEPCIIKQHKRQTKVQQLASPPQDQVSSTQDQIDSASTDQTSSSSSENHQTSITLIDVTTSPNQVQSSPSQTYASTTTTTTTSNLPKTRSRVSRTATNNKLKTSVKRRKIAKSSDHDTSSTTSWSSSYTSISARSSPDSNTESESSSCSTSSSSSDSPSTTCTSPSSSPTPSPYPSSTPDIVKHGPKIEPVLKKPFLKLSEEKISKVKKRPLTFDDFEGKHPFQSTPTASNGCSPGQHSITLNSEISRPSVHVFHMFQAPPKFVNNLKPCNLIPKPPTPVRVITPQPTKELLRCAICGVKEELPAVSRIYGQNSCILCAGFFTAFMKTPQQLYCAQDGDCLMTVDSRCQACWIKICLQKFEIDDECRKIGHKYSPKLLSSPNVSLITIDTSLSR